MMNACQLATNTAEAWRKYVSIGALSPGLLRAHVLRAWERAHDYGANPWTARAETLSPAGLEQLQLEHERLIAAARRYMQLLSSEVGEERHAVTLATPDAIVLDVVGEEQCLHGPERVPGPGSLLSEAACGSSGIGTTLAEQRYIELVSTEHFTHGLHAFTCNGIPIETPNGEVLGALSITLRRPEVLESFHEVLICAARGIGTEIARRRLADRVHDVVAALEPAMAPLHALFAEVGRLGGGARSRKKGPGMPDSSLGGAPKRRSDSRATVLQEMMAVLKWADDMGQALERRERAWHELASDEPGNPEDVEMHHDISELLALLETDLRRSRVEVSYQRDAERVDAFTDVRTLRRDLFRSLLRGIATAEGGGDMKITLGAGASGLRRVDVEAAPPPGSPQTKWTSSVVCPARRRPLA